MKTAIESGDAAAETLWTAMEVARYLRVSRSWVYQHAEAGRLPVIRLLGSSLLRFDPEKIRSYALGEWQPAQATPLRPLTGREA